MSNDNNTLNLQDPAAPVAWMGLDWGDKQHAYALQDRSDRKEEQVLKQSAETVHGWLRELEQRYGQRLVAVGIEAGQKPVIEMLKQYDWLIIYPINPITSARYRTAFTPSGACDDMPDARVLLELVRHHSDKLRPLVSQDDQTRKLDGLTRARRDTVDRRTQSVNQLTSLLKSYFPQALELAGKLTSPMALEFLKRWPDLIALKAAKPATIKQFYHRHNLRRPELLEKRLQLIKSAQALTTDEVVLEVARLQLRLLIDQLAVYHRHIDTMDKKIKAAFAEHPEKDLFRDLPGAGASMAPRLCAAFGTVRSLYPTPDSMQKFFGVAPVREKSGQQVWTHWRRNAPKFLRQTFIEWAGLTVVYSLWAKKYYERMKSKKKRHGAILRALAFKWIRILWRCWVTNTPYNEAQYLQQLRYRKSPNAVA